MNSAVLLSTSELVIRKDSRKPLDLALLSGSMLAALGDETTVAPELGRILAGRSGPVSGRILPGDVSTIKEKADPGMTVGYVPGETRWPKRISVRAHLELAAAAAGYPVRKTTEAVNGMLEWCSLEDSGERSVTGLPREKQYLVSFATTCISVPKVLVLQGPCPTEVHELLEDLCEYGSAVVVCVPGIEHIPRGTDRVAVCDGSDVRKILRFEELAEASSALTRLRVGFLPALPREVMESLTGIRNIIAVEKGYEFLYASLSPTVTNLVNLARANSRSIVSLEVRPPTNAELLEYLTGKEDTGEANLFCEEDLDTSG